MPRHPRRWFIKRAGALSVGTIAGCAEQRSQTNVSPTTASPTSEEKTTAESTEAPELGLWVANDLTVLNHREEAIIVDVVVTPSDEQTPVFGRRLELGPRVKPYSPENPESGAVFEDVPTMDLEHRVSVCVVDGPSASQSFGPQPDSNGLTIIISDDAIEFDETEV
ncbi:MULTISPECIES: hypothetical protein [Haloferax]|uniref:Uncharacterized protein n=2 Tax=Haloferax TaxID=2251 RepID=A0A6G1Z556_9EURY|nr:MULTISPECIES: hypothetical protein [Haloferax]KAB1188842.1 hypothetical protein Hfx1149_12670 [Haloferax sp. CBA1149]MRW81558.1 hypothetical protein [Haloferax marinisediminis]